MLLQLGLLIFTIYTLIHFSTPYNRKIKSKKMQEVHNFDSSFSKDSFSAVTTDSVTQNPVQQAPIWNESSCHSPSLFSSTVEGKSVSQNMVRKGVNWVLGIAWTKDYSLQSGWTTLMMFHGYRANRLVKKTQLETILLVCLQLATKIHETFPLKIVQLMACCSSPVSKETIFELQAEILELFNYDICIPTTLESMWGSMNIDQNDLIKVSFLAELYLTRGAGILFDSNKARRLLEIVKKSSRSESYSLQLLEIHQMAFESSNKMLVNKFSNKFDMEQFLSHFQ